MGHWPERGLALAVIRDATERQEGIEAGMVRPVGSDKNELVAVAEQFLIDSAADEAMARRANPYGDGAAGERIADVLMAADHTSAADDLPTALRPKAERGGWSGTEAVLPV